MKTPENTQSPKAARRPRETRPKKVGAAASRDAKGRWLRGATSPNPGGRPLIATEVREFAGEHSIEALRKTVHIMRTSRDHSTVLAAARTILDRAIGKPQQLIAGAGGLVNITMNGGAIVNADDAMRAYQEICGNPHADITGLAFVAPTRSTALACPELPAIDLEPARPTKREEFKELMETLGK